MRLVMIVTFCLLWYQSSNSLVRMTTYNHSSSLMTFCLLTLSVVFFGDGNEALALGMVSGG